MALSIASTAVFAPRIIPLVVVEDGEARAMRFLERQYVSRSRRRAFPIDVFAIEDIRKAEPRCPIEVPFLVDVAGNPDERATRRNRLVDRAASALADRHVGDSHHRLAGQEVVDVHVARRRKVRQSGLGDDEVPILPPGCLDHQREKARIARAADGRVNRRPRPVELRRQRLHLRCDCRSAKLVDRSFSPSSVRPQKAA
jgi:hypothetical protein